MNVLLGFVNATSGAAYLFGVDVREPIARQRIGYLPELTYYYKFLTAEELLRFYARIFGIPRAEADRRIDATAEAGRVGIRPQAPHQDLLQGHAAAGGAGPGADQQPGPADPRRADQRPGPAWPHEGARDHPAAEERGQDRLLLLPRAGRGRDRLRPRRHHQPGRTQGRRARRPTWSSSTRPTSSRYSSRSSATSRSRRRSRNRHEHCASPFSSVVIKELYRRKDFYVLFVLTAVITLVMGSVSFFHDTKIVRYVKDIALLLIWISALVIAIATTARQIPAERENRTIFPLLAKPVTRWQVILGKFAGCWLACGLALIVFYLFFGVCQRHARAPLAAAELLPGALAAMGHAGRGRRLRAARLGGLHRPFLQCHDLASSWCWAFCLLGRYLNQVALQQAEPVRETLVYGALLPDPAPGMVRRAGL